MVLVMTFLDTTPRASSMEERVNSWYMHTMEYCLALKGDELSWLEGIWRSLKCVWLAEGGQSERAMYHSV